MKKDPKHLETKFTLYNYITIAVYELLLLTICAGAYAVGFAPSATP